MGFTGKAIAIVSVEYQTYTFLIFQGSLCEYLLILLPVRASFRNSSWKSYIASGPTILDQLPLPLHPTNELLRLLFSLPSVLNDNVSKSGTHTSGHLVRRTEVMSQYTIRYHGRAETASRLTQRCTHTRPCVQ